MFYKKKKKKSQVNTQKKQIFQIPICQHWSHDISTNLTTTIACDLEEYVNNTAVVMCHSFVNYFTLVNEWSTSHFENEVLHSLNYALNARSVGDLFLWNFSKDSLNFFLYFLRNVSKISP